MSRYYGACHWAENNAVPHTSCKLNLGNWGPFLGVAEAVAAHFDGWGRQVQKKLYEQSQRAEWQFFAFAFQLGPIDELATNPLKLKSSDSVVNFTSTYVCTVCSVPCTMYHVHTVQTDSSQVTWRDRWGDSLGHPWSPFPWGSLGAPACKCATAWMAEWKLKPICIHDTYI